MCATTQKQGQACRNQAIVSMLLTGCCYASRVGEECTEEVRDLIDICMRTNVNERPSAMDIVHKLQVAFPPALTYRMPRDVFKADNLASASPGAKCPAAVAHWVLDPWLRIAAASLPSPAAVTGWLGSIESCGLTVWRVQALPPQPSTRVKREGSTGSFKSPLDQAHASSDRSSDLTSSNNSSEASNFKFYQVRRLIAAWASVFSSFFLTA